jgi:hypothetical protein
MTCQPPDHLIPAYDDNKVNRNIIEIANCEKWKDVVYILTTLYLFFRGPSRHFVVNLLVSSLFAKKNTKQANLSQIERDFRFFNA